MADDAHQAAVGAAAWLAGQLRNAIRRRGRALLAVSGGSTPAAMLRALAARDLEWSQVAVWQIDERIAPDGDPARNATQLEVLTDAGAKVHLMPVTSRDLAAAARRYASRLPDRFDVVHLGLGDDGHTASWQPGDERVVTSHKSVEICGPFNGHQRMTLTPRVVNGARHRLLLATGSGKATALAGWMLRDPSLPVQHVRRTATVVVVDADAAAALPHAR